MKKNKNIFAIIISILLFLSFGYTLLDDAITYKLLSFGFMACAIAYLFKERKQISFKNPVILSVFTYAILSGVSTLYANAGKFAINEYIKILLAFAIFLIVAIWVKNDAKALNVVLWCATTLSFATAILSIDGATLGIISSTIETLIYGMDILDYANWGGNRISSIFGNSNVFASMLGVNLFLSLYLYVKSEKNKYKYIQALYLITQASAFLLAFSMGGTASIVVAVLAYVIFAKNDEKYSSIIVALQVLLISLAGVVLSIGTYAMNAPSNSVLPLFMIIVGTVVFVFCDKIIGRKIAKVICKYNKQTAVLIIVIVLLVGGATTVLLTSTSSSVKLSAEEYINRTIYPSAGEYSININSTSEDLLVSVLTRNSEQIILNTDTSVWTSASEDETFIIDDDVEQVRIIIKNESLDQANIESVILQGEENIELKLTYKYLPENIVSRIQGLRTNNSLMTRLQYFQDSWTLFLQSPIIGHGLGGFENAVQSVQKYQYETKYAHNHFFQVMVDMGILGLLSYLFLLGSCIVALAKKRKENDLAPMLLGALMMIIVHGANEFSMSSGEFLPFAFMIFALIATISDVKIDKLEPYNGKILTGVICIMSLFTLLLAGNIAANINIKGGSVTLSTLTQNAAIDVYEKNDYKLSYVLATSKVDDADIANTRDNYLKSLEKAKSNTISLYLAGYYIENGNPQKSYEQIENYIEYSLYDPDTWNTAFTQYIGTMFTESNISSFYQNKQAYIDIIDDLLLKLNYTNESSISKIIIDDMALMNIRNIYASQDIESTEDFLTYVDTVIYDSKYDTLINNKGTYDALYANNTSIDIKCNTTNSGERVRIRVPYTYYAMYIIEIDSENVSKIAAPSEEIAFTVTDEGKTIAFLDTNTVSSMLNATEGYIDVIVNFTGDDAYFGGVKISR